MLEGTPDSYTPKKSNTQSVVLISLGVLLFVVGLIGSILSILTKWVLEMQNPGLIVDIANPFGYVIIGMVLIVVGMSIRSDLTQA
jgi:predicted permease